MSLSDDEQPLLRHQRCRTCLSKLGKHNIFATNSIQMLAYLMDIEIENGDNLPTGLCDECLSSLRQAYSFKKKCEMTYSILIQERELDEQLNCLQTTTTTEQDYNDEKQTEEMDSDLPNENDTWIQFQQNSIFLNERFEENNSSPTPNDILHIRLEQVESDAENTNLSNGSHNCSEHISSIDNVSQADLIKLLQNYGLNEKFPILMTCGVCGKKIHREHFLKGHTNSELSTCEYCGLPFGNLSDLKKHISSAHLVACETIICDSDNNDGRVKNLENELDEEDDNHFLKIKKRLRVPDTKMLLQNSNDEPKIIIIDDPDEEDQNIT